MYRLKIAEADFEQLRAWVLSDYPREAGAFALAGARHRNDGTDVLVRRPVEVPRALFQVQREERLEVSSQAVNGLAALCEVNKTGAVVCHSHPEDTPYSPSDDYGEQRVFETLVPFVPGPAPLASLLFHPAGVRGRIWIPSQGRFVPMSEILVIGRCVRRIKAGGLGKIVATEVDGIYDRQIRAFGKEGQFLISGAKVGVVGVGGTGSATAEQLARLGVTDIVLVDPDTFSPSNLSRMYGTFATKRRRRWWPWNPANGPHLKVDLVAEHLVRIQPGIRATRIPQSVVLRNAAQALLDRDVLFLCTDEHWGRSVVNELAYQYLIPTINLGMSIRSRDSRITGGSGAVDVVRPGTACLWCSQFLNAGRITAESLSRKKRRILHGEGYVEDLDTPTPSVISVTTTLSGMAVTAFLQIMTDFMGSAGAISHLRYDIMTGSVRRGTTDAAAGCVCQKVKGYGDLRPLTTLESLPRDE